MRVIDEIKFHNGQQLYESGSPEEILYSMGITCPLDTDFWSNFIIPDSDLFLTPACQRLEDSRLIETRRETDGLKVRWDYVIPHYPFQTVEQRIEQDTIIEIEIPQHTMSIHIPAGVSLSENAEFKKFLADTDWDSSMPLDEFYEAFKRAQKGV